MGGAGRRVAIVCFAAFAGSVAACMRRAATPEHATAAASTEGDTTSRPAPATAPAAFAVGAAHGGIETECNGVDDDGDGLVDVLLPKGPNACARPLLGACASGFAACEGNRRVCFGPAPMPEVVDGIDNDCNGQVDDVPVVRVHPRAVLIAPRYVWTDAAPDVATVSTVLAQAGIPFDIQAPGTDWQPQLQSLGRYALAVIPGYLLGAAMGSGARAQLEQFASRGGIVIIFKPVGSSQEPQAWTLAGLRSSTRRRDLLDIRFDGTRPPAVTDIDSPEERTLAINGHATQEAVEAYLFDPDPSAGTQVVAHAFGGALSGPTITRRPLGKGAIYAVGHDLATFGTARCYVNCFEPSGDVMRLFLEGAFREAAAGHVVLLHTVPGEESSALVMTHDMDSPDAFKAGPWGPAGALQMARAEQMRGVRATFNVATDYVSGRYDERTVRELCGLGMCPVGAQGVSLPDDFARLPVGTCTETRAGYGAQKSLCGEIRVSRDLLAEATGRAPRLWRSPSLSLPPQLFELLAKNGFAFDSGFGVGDLPYNLPLDLSSVGFHQNRFRRSPLIEFPLCCEDVREEGQRGARRPRDLDATNRAWFSSIWQYVMLRNAQNRSMTTLLVHPARGRDSPPDSLQTKVDTVGALLDQAAAAGVIARPLEDVGDFWRARLDAALDASYDSESGYSGTLVIGRTTAPGLTLEFGDVIYDFSCAACGEFRVHGKRVVLLSAPPPGTRAAFTVRVK